MGAGRFNTRMIASMPASVLASAPAGSPAEEEPARPAVRVLYVDDEPSLCRAFVRMFVNEADVSVTTSTSALEASGLIESEAFDVIVSDLRMPAMDGIEFLSVARAKLPDARRLLVSGYADLDSAISAINRVGVDRLLTKPWNTGELVTAVRAAGEHARLLRENAAMTQALRRKNQELADINRELDRLVEERTNNLLNGLVSALDLRDSETQWHSRRVGLYARRLAEELGVRGRDLDDIERGAMLHDIGKIGVRDAVLLKPGPLNEEEWQEMRRHPALGYDILSDIKFLERARLIPLHHQERWDGSGYPGGLKGADICLGARIFAVVDTYDAITSNRPYRAARAYEVARMEIERFAGTQFDPEVVTAWLRVPAAEWVRIRRELEAEGGGEE
jgi:response regulator RpfG family c-di-GMP phosphodiesterase